MNQIFRVFLFLFASIDNNPIFKPNSVNNSASHSNNPLYQG